MTDASFPLVKPVNGPDLIHAPLSAAFAPFPHQRYPEPVVDGVHEDDGQIHCVCGYTDDDGLTVACDICNRWQHIVCYYPHYENGHVPEDLQHFCVECRPQPIDIEKARIKQRARREHTEPLTNGSKRNSSKGQKKKAKESGVPYTNGWALDKGRHDRNSASPRDQPPPAKRPKTSHRTSDSTTTTTNSKNHSRKRNLSNVHHARAASRSPDASIGLYSDEFLQYYHEDSWDITHANLHNSISITNSLSAWLNASEDAFKEEHGYDKTGVFMRWDGELDDIPGRADIEIRTDQDDTVQYNGQHPTWKLVTVKEPIAKGAYIGELKGHVGFKKEYQADASNRWSHLRHPEPFVFFHPKLPIVIDARNEGTELRYIRRSCVPNARLQILVTDGVDYHFCFMATEQIDPGVEVAVGWDTSDGLPELVSRNNVSNGEIGLLSNWVSTALANCGPCACQLPEGEECKMSRFDRRSRDHREEPQPVKAPKPKKRKAGQHVSPLNTHGINSRSGSEVRKVDADDEPTDSRSASGSAGRGSASRDITPNTHYSTNGSLGTMPELSERERKKLAKEEEMFRRQEEERAIKQGKKKRNSGGSSMNTPNASSTKPLGYGPTSSTSRYVDAATGSRQPGQLSSKTATVKRTKSQKSTPRPVAKPIKRSQPAYAHTHQLIQCDLDTEEAAVGAFAEAVKKTFLPHRQRLLQRVARINDIHHAQSLARARQPVLTAPDESTMEIDHPAACAVPTPSVPETAAKSEEILTAPLTSTADVEMSDAASTDKQQDSTIPEVAVKTADDETMSRNGSMSFNEAPSPPKDEQAPTLPEPRPSDHSHKPVDMHVQMPPPQANPFAAPVPPLSAGTPGSTLAQSPASLTGPPTIFPSSVTAAVTPPARKKMSLSDYTRRNRKAKDKDHETKTERESSPASTASGPIVPPLQPSTSSEANAAEGGSAIEEDVRMEDVGETS